jgi:hypothetical protein
MMDRFGRKGGGYRRVQEEGNKKPPEREVLHSCTIPLRATGLLRPLYQESTGACGLVMGNLVCGEGLDELGVRYIPLPRAEMKKFVSLVLPNPVGSEFEVGGTLTARLVRRNPED